LILGIIFIFNGVQFQFIDIVKYSILYSVFSFLSFSMEIKYNKKDPLYNTKHRSCFSILKKHILFKSIFHLFAKKTILLFHVISLSFIFIFFDEMIWNKIFLIFGFIWMVLNSAFLAIIVKDIATRISSNTHSLYVQIYILIGLSSLAILNSNEKLMDVFIYFPINGVYCFSKQTIIVQSSISLLITTLLIVYINKTKWKREK